MKSGLPPAQLASPGGRSVRHAAQLALQGLQAVVPTGADLGQPGGRSTEPAGNDAITDLPAVPLGVEQSGRGQGAQVLDYRLAGHRVAGSQLRCSQRTFAGQLVEESTARRVRQSGKDGIDVGFWQGGGDQALTRSHTAVSKVAEA